MRIDDIGYGRPNDVRGFIHKRILGLAGTVARTVTNIPGVSLLPGSGFIRTAGNIATRLSRSDLPPEREIIGLPPSERLPFSGGRGGNERVPADIRTVVEAKQRMQAGNGVQSCPSVCPPAVGNRRVNAAGECAPPGFHWNVSSYTRIGGPCSTFAAGFVERGTVLVKNRKMNNANGGAQDKALKRIERGQDHAKRILRATGWRTISKQSSREMRMRRRGHR